MLFTFKRDDEGRERIYCDGVCVFTMDPNNPPGHRGELGQYVHGVNGSRIDDAIDIADAAGFWSFKMVPSPPPLRSMRREFVNNEVTVDVPIAETTVMSVTLEGEDQS